jgi:hypothetical protein
MPIILAIAGMSIIYGAMAPLYYIEGTIIRFIVASLGILMLLTAMWFASNPFLTEERLYIALRAEVDRFIGLVRQLNTATVGGDAGEIEHSKSEMHESVDRMAELAGKEEAGPSN